MSTSDCCTASPIAAVVVATDQHDVGSPVGKREEPRETSLRPGSDPYGGGPVIMSIGQLASEAESSRLHNRLETMLRDYVSAGFADTRWKTTTRASWVVPNAR
ncbi:MAG: hypothetical protein ACR2HR_09515 [Euzebya sp.]